MDIPRVRLRPVFVVMAMGCVTLFLVVPLVAAVLVLILAPVTVSVWVTLGAVAFVGGIGYAVSSSVQWVELDDGNIRWRYLLTRSVHERPVAELVDALPLNSAMMGSLENAILDSMMRTSNRGTSWGSGTGRSSGWSGATWPGWTSSSGRWRRSWPASGMSRATDP